MSSLHTTGVEEFVKNGVAHVQFKILPFHRIPDKNALAEAKVIELRLVRGSSGWITNRPVIVTDVP